GRIGDMGGIVIDEVGGQPRHLVRGGGAALAFEAAFDHAAGARTDHFASRMQRDRGQPLAFEHKVERVDEVRRGIHQGAVEIEYNGAGRGHPKSLSVAAQSCKGVPLNSSITAMPRYSAVPPGKTTL